MSLPRPFCIFLPIGVLVVKPYTGPLSGSRPRIQSSSRLCRPGSSPEVSPEYGPRRLRLALVALEVALKAGKTGCERASRQERPPCDAAPMEGTIPEGIPPAGCSADPSRGQELRSGDGGRRTEQVVPAFTQLAAVADRELLFDQGLGIGAGPDTARARTMAGSLSGAPAGEARARKRPVTVVELAHWPSLRPEKVRD